MSAELISQRMALSQSLRRLAEHIEHAPLTREAWEKIDGGLIEAQDQTAAIYEGIRGTSTEGGAA